jgi:hypothetical protein
MKTRTGRRARRMTTHLLGLRIQLMTSIGTVMTHLSFRILELISEWPLRNTAVCHPYFLSSESLLFVLVLGNFWGLKKIRLKGIPMKRVETPRHQWVTTAKMCGISQRSSLTITPRSSSACKQIPKALFRAIRLVKFSVFSSTSSHYMIDEILTGSKNILGQGIL